MSILVFNVTGILTIVAFLLFANSVWQHEWVRMLLWLGVSAIGFGLWLNARGISDLATSDPGAGSGYSQLPQLDYDLPLYVGLALLIAAWVMSIWLHVKQYGFHHQHKRAVAPSHATPEGRNVGVVDA